MDELPQDLLIGVSPLVFAVSTLASDGNIENPTSSRRSLFDRFLDALAASLVDDGPMEQDSSSESRRSSSLSLFRPDDESSDEEDYELFGGAAGTQKRKGSSVSTGFYAGFGRRSIAASHSTDSGAADSPTNYAKGKVISYAKALQNGQGFFQRARIVSVSTQHGLPPCKDPEGTDNLASSLAPFLKNRDPKLGKMLVDSYPLNGILTAGWLDKHVHALPSVILVVCTVCGSQKEQDIADKRLLETISNFEVSMVPKRQCTIHVVGLMTDDVTVLQGEEWTRAISGMVMDDDLGGNWFRVALLRATSDLQAGETGFPTSRALRELHQSVRDASMQYYLGQARRTKDKLAKLTLDKLRQGRDLPPEPVLPLVIRYCFKIAMFYEFQWKHEKSLRFMAEAYRHAAKYYNYLLYLREHPAENDGTGDESAHSISIAGDELEVSLANNSVLSLEALWNQIIPPPPDDMIHQCRAVAEWLNLKLLQAGFASHTEGGLLAADNQWRHHCRLFCSRRNSPLFKTNDWFEWVYIARNWLTMSELVQRHPPKALGDLGNEYDEVLLRCSPWRTYEATVEATLCMWRAVESSKTASEEYLDLFDREDPMRARYVGAFGSEGLRPILRELYGTDYRAKALDLALRAISLYEAECEREKRGFYAENHAKERATSRAGARLYYSAGGVLLGMGQHKEAATYLEKAAKFSSGWPGLELAIRKMLIDCYEEHTPSSKDSKEESNQALVSMILDSYFNAKMSAQSLRRALDHFASMTGGGESLNWFHESEHEEDKSLPFSFAVSFPDRTHATAGDSVKASVLITSNLDYAVFVNTAVLLSLAGELAIPTLDLLSAENASEGHDGGIIIQSKTSIIIATEVELPKDTSIIAIDDSGNGGETQGTAGKGSFAKSARPRSAGVTSAGGSRLLPEDDNAFGDRVSQGWSLRFLGGKSLRCDGLRLTFYPVQVEKAVGGESVTYIQLTLMKKKPKTPANIKRTPFEEDNYIASAWSRPIHLPLSRGPSSLRVLGPQPELVIKNITEDATMGKAVEGTINRVVFRLTAGPKERCQDIHCRISCFSVLLTPAGSTLRLVPEDEVLAEGEGSVTMSNPSARTPCLVSSASDLDTTCCKSAFGYDLPDGWDLAESGTAFNAPCIPSLNSSESTFVQMTMFRPPPAAHVAVAEDDDALDFGETSICKTDIYVNISYQKERPPKNSSKRIDMRAASRRRARPVMSTAHKTGIDNSADIQCTAEIGRGSEDTVDMPRYEEVTLEYTGSVVWGQPLSTKFQPMSCHKGFGAVQSCSFNDVRPVQSLERSSCTQLMDGDNTTTRCTFEANDEDTESATEIVAVRFQAAETSEAKVILIAPQLTTDSADFLYVAGTNDPCANLSFGSRLSVAYTANATLKHPGNRPQAITSLGSVWVDWRPSLLPLPEDAMSFFKSKGVYAHGPLRLSTPSSLCFTGPRCRIAKASIEVRLLPLQSTPFANELFQVRYRIKNCSRHRQEVKVSRPLRGEHKALGELLLTGMTQGEVSLAPDETVILTFTALSTTAGKATLPPVTVVAARNNTNIVEMKGNEIYILPSTRSVDEVLHRAAFEI